MPFIIGSTTPIIAFVAIAASTAFPPRSSMRTPACAASGDSAATIPPRDITIDRPCPRSCAKIPAVAIIINVTIDPQTRAFRIFSPLLEAWFFTSRALYRGRTAPASAQKSPPNAGPLATDQALARLLALWRFHVHQSVLGIH